MICSPFPSAKMESSIPPATSFRHSQICSAEGAPHTTIRLRKLSCQALLGDDPWRRARDRQNIFQPVFLSATLSLRKPFQSAADADVINDSTVNYSTLTKAIQKVVASRQPESETDWSVNDFLDSIFLYLTGYLPNSNGLNNADLAKSRILGDFASVDQNTLLKRDDLKEFVLEAFLPKGSLLSGGITLTKSVYYSASDNEGVKTIQQSYCSILKIHDMQIPTLIGINSNERTARQLIVASVEIDPYIPENRDSYNDLHKIVFETIEESSFETLESLAMHVADRVIDLFILPYRPYESGKGSTQHSRESQGYSLVKICLEKPSAVTFADGPVIEVVRSSKPQA